MTENTTKRSPPASRVSNERRSALAVERAAGVFAAKNLRFTKLRQQVFAEIASTHTATGAYDVLERLAEKGTRLAPISVYRAIDALMEAGVVQRLESQNAFFACRVIDAKDRQQLVQACEECGAVSEIEGAAIYETIERISQAAGFTPHVKFVEVTGLCAKCARAIKAAAPG